MNCLQKPCNQEVQENKPSDRKLVQIYYVYALKDPRTMKPFYIGKGSGARAWEHLINFEDNSKGKRIQEIQNAGYNPIVHIICAGLDEIHAIALEAEIISTFGTEATGGILTNVVIPSGKTSRQKRKINVPPGALERAQLGLALIKGALLELAQANENGITNAEAARALDLKSDHNKENEDYLTFSVIGLMLQEGRLKRVEKAKGRGAFFVDPDISRTVEKAF